MVPRGSHEAEGVVRLAREDTLQPLQRCPGGPEGGVIGTGADVGIDLGADADLGPGCTYAPDEAESIPTPARIHTPRWAFRPWISKDISDTADTYAFVDGFRDRDIPVGTVKSLLHRGMLNLRARVRAVPEHRRKQAKGGRDTDVNGHSVSVRR